MSRTGRRLGRFALGLIVGLSLIIGIGARSVAFILAYADGPNATPAIADTSQDPYGSRRPDDVGYAVADVGGSQPLTAALWYPAVINGLRDPSITYAFEKQLGPPLGSVVVATYAGAASRNAPPDRTIGRRPLIVLSPGFAIGSGAYAWLAEHLASHGFVVIAADHSETLDPGGMWAATIDRPADVSAFLASIAEKTPLALADMVDLNSVAGLGHSYGEYTALATAGARLDTAGFEAICDDAASTGDPITFLCEALHPRLADMAVRAGLRGVPGNSWPSWGTRGVDASAVLAGDARMFGAEGLHYVNVPVLSIGGTADEDAPFRWGTQPAFEHTSGRRKAEVGFVGAEHLVFTGPCERSRRLLILVATPFCADPAWHKADVHAVIRSFVTAFLLAEMAGDGEAASRLSMPTDVPPDVTYRTEGS